mgnify:CR=1 FL=1
MKPKFPLIVLLLAMISMTATATTTTSSTTTENAVAISSKSANEKSGEIVFDATVSSTGEYALSMWQCAASTLNGILQSYSVVVNGVTSNLVATPTESGWCELAFPEPIMLKKGLNKIAVKVDLPHIPNIEFIELHKPSDRMKSRMSQSSSYRDYISAISQNANSTRYRANSETTIGKDTIGLSIGNYEPYVPYDFQYRRVPWFGYTFYTNAYFRQGQVIACASEGVNGIQHFLEVFDSGLPDKNSWCALSKDGKAQLVVTIPRSGTYIIKVRTYKNGTTGLCNLTVNNLMRYENVPICSMGVNLGKYIDSSDIHNVFTVSNDCDPVIWLMKGDYPTHCTVFAYNDNYASKGDFDWNYNSRINQKLPRVIDISRVVISSSSSFNPIGKCEIYAGCKSSPVTYYFENLKQDDALSSGLASSTYNCISWTGGITSYWEWPCYPGSAYYVPGGNSLSCFDLFYSSERFPGCIRYTRSGATANNSAVDLWGFLNNGVYEYTHGSISKNSDKNHHGYDWESKPGSLTRTFHPRNALSGTAYGKVLQYYRVSNSGTDNSSLESAVANNLATIDNVKLTSGQEALILNSINSINSQTRTNFETLYNTWEGIWNSSIFSNPDKIKDCEPYTMLLNLCRNNNSLNYLVFDKLNKGIQSVIPLFEDLFISNNSNALNHLLNIQIANNNLKYDEDGKLIVRTISTNLKHLLKQMLPSNQNMPEKDSQKSQSNSINNNFSINLCQGAVDINIQLEKQSYVSLAILNQDGSIVKNLITPKEIEAGSYNISTELPSEGLYLVRYMVNGELFVKKVTKGF